MGRFILLLVTGGVVFGWEVGIKIGNAYIDWKGTGERTTLHGFVSFYLDVDYPASPFVVLSPSLELGFGRRSVGEFFCPGWGPCRLDLTYTTLELNGKAKFRPVPYLDLYGGAGISYSRFGIDAYDLPTGVGIGTITDERGAGFQAFGGFQVRIRGVGIGGEYRIKRVDTESVEGVDTLTFVISYRF
ncbi:MAG: outer membrane beta-barrel protein [Aquificota bacterium]|nr:outer membrane beta-barrel protein [Aquificota bacterium]MDQ7083392.1 outer membrane beta-barrel protein [Aquificota bacterium]